ncbi:anti-sigma factor family protein [Actinomadura rifamycini]|uniref:anti-sigma factor family protein n=1 Tax=Actinomadura rifamycini TaxID=31962 RepID=UPI000402DA5A|nr:zf-HC2 domain-containing protein [Actinomadura rifamycini]
MSCLGERLTALVDGELGHDERERAHAHLAVCARCRAEAATLRSLKGRLRGLGGAPEPGADDLPSDDFLTRLRALGAPAPGEPDDPSVTSPSPLDPPDPSRPSGAPDRFAFPGRPGEPGPHGEPAAARGRSARPRRSSGRPSRPSRPVRAAAFAAPRDTRPAGHGAALAHPRRRLLAMGAATLVLGLGTASYAAGGGRSGPAVTPEFDRFAIEHAMTSGDAPVTTGTDPRPLGRTGPTPSAGAAPGADASGGPAPGAGPIASPVASVPVPAGP